MDIIPINKKLLDRLCEKKSVNIKYKTTFYDKIKLSEEAVFLWQKKERLTEGKKNIIDSLIEEMKAVNTG